MSIKRRPFWPRLVVAACIMGLFLGSPASAAKSNTNLLTEQEIATIRQAKEWPGGVAAGILGRANNWMRYTPQELRNLVPPAWVPRAVNVNFDSDPLHPEEIKKIGQYPWIISPDMPYKVKCPVGGEIYPTNDFDPTHPPSLDDVSEEAYVDNGWGWKKPGESEKYWFVAYYAHWLWHDYLHPAAKALGQAYVLTGEQKYARQAAILLDRVAEEYPQMDYVKQSRNGTEIQVDNYPGRVLNKVWETALVRDFAEAYDYIFPALAGDVELEKATGKSVADIKHNIETNLLENAAQSIYTADGRVSGNYGMHQSTLAVLATVLDNENTEKYLHYVLYGTGKGTFVEEGVFNGLTNFVFRDGAPNESSPGYNSLWISQINRVAKVLLKSGIDLYEELPKLKRLFDYPLRVAMLNAFSPNIGDTGTVKSKGIEGGNLTAFQDAYQQYGDPKYLLGQQTNDESDNMSAYGLALLRTGKNTNAVGMSMYYGPGGSHDHYDRLNLELFAEGMRLSPDLGYPEYANIHYKRTYAWTGNTVSHNTVVVDAQRQENKEGGELQAFAALPNAQYIDVRAEEAYATTVDRYQRSVALINTTAGDSYALDVFRVHGGSEHDYSLHGPDGTFTAENLALSAVRPGTLAGADVPYAYLYDDPAKDEPGYTGVFYTYRGSGFSYLKNVQEAVASNSWSADWNAVGTDIHFRTTFLPQEGTRVFVADGVPPRNKVGNPATLKYVLARTEAPQGAALGSTFVSVMQSFQEKPFVIKVDPLGQKAPAGSEETVGVRVEHAAGTDYVFQSVNAGQSTWGNDLSFQGLFGVISRTHGGLVDHAELVGGGRLVQGDVEIVAGGSYTGLVEAVDYETGWITVKLEDAAPSMPVGEALIGQRIIFSNSQHATEYQVKQVTPVGNKRYRLELTDTEFLTGRGKVDRVGTDTISSATPLVLGKYYKGQWLVNLDSGAGARIEDLQNKGGQIRLAADSLGLKPDDTFAIYDFAAGDQFKIVSTVHLEAKGRGKYEVTSNVPAHLKLWDGQVQTVAPGTQTVAVLVPNMSIAGLPTEGAVKGDLRPVVSVAAPAGLELKKVIVQVDATSIYEGYAAPDPGELVVNTRDLADGEHTLTVNATDAWGKTTSKTRQIQVENWWTVKTELQEPVATGFFGVVDLTEIEEKSSGWEFVGGSRQDFAGDNDRMATTGQDEYLIWKTPALSSVQLVFYAKAPQLDKRIEFEVSEDGKNWRRLALAANAKKIEKSGWYQMDVSGKLSPEPAICFFRVRFREGLTADDVQIGSVELRGLIQ